MSSTQAGAPYAQEIRLSPGVFRVGDTVRRRLRTNSARVHALLEYLERSGFDAAPRFLGIDDRNREILSFIEGETTPDNGLLLSDEAIRVGARLVRRIHDLTEGTEFAAGGEVACHGHLRQPNFIFRDSIPVAIIDWDRTHPGRRVDDLAGFIWTFVHPALFGDGEPAARMVGIAAAAYGWSGTGLVDAMLKHVRDFQAYTVGKPYTGAWATDELEHTERNADAFRAALGRTA